MMMPVNYDQVPSDSHQTVFIELAVEQCSCLHEFGAQFAHALGGSLLNLRDVFAGADGVGVYEIDGHAGTNVVEQSGGRIDIERRSDDDKDVGLLCFFSSCGNEGNSLAEEYDEGTQQRTVAGFRSRFYLTIVRCQCYLIARVVNIPARTTLHQFTMQMDDL